MNNRIPAGLTDPHMEIYLREGSIEFIRHGSVHPFDRMDVNDLSLFRELMEADTRAMDAIDELGITDPVEQIKRWITCNFGDFDARADLSADGVVIREYWDCGRRGRCPQEGRLCTLPSGINGQLTPREIEVIKLVACDLADKEIADRLCISVNTVCVHRSNIEHKIGAHSKVGIAIFAKDHNIISND